MKMTNLKKTLSLLLLTVFIAAMALTSAGCSDTEKPQPPQNSEAVDLTTMPSHSHGEDKDVTYLGYGENVFELTVTDYDSNESYFHIHTDKETVGEALLDLGLIAGDEGAYGLYVKTVNGITADYDKDGKYWAFYIDGEYTMSGVDVTKIEAGKAYAFRVE